MSPVLHPAQRKHDEHRDAQREHQEKYFREIFSLTKGFKQGINTTTLVILEENKHK